MVKVKALNTDAANRALELLGKELGMWAGEGRAHGDRDPSEKAPIKTANAADVVRWLDRYREKRTPADLLGRKFRQDVKAAETK
jgi:hypothetical protein